MWRANSVQGCGRHRRGNSDCLELFRPDARVDQKPHPRTVSNGESSSAVAGIDSAVGEWPGNTLMQNTPFVSVLMPVRNEGAFIARSLGAVVSQDYPRDRLEVIVSDGMSTDSTREVIADISRQHANVVLIDNLEKIAATGLNQALRVARGEIIVRVDGHCEIASDYVRHCVSHLLDDKAECVGGPLETIGETFTAQAIAAAMSSRFGVGGSAFRVGTKEPRLTDTVAFPAYKRETIQRAGDFDEELVRNQDDEYNYRVRKLGGRILLSPDVRSRYYSRAGFASLWKQYFAYGYW